MRSAQVQLSRSKQKAKRLKQIKTARLFLHLLVQRAAEMNSYFVFYALFCKFLALVPNYLGSPPLARIPNARIHLEELSQMEDGRKTLPERNCQNKIVVIGFRPNFSGYYRNFQFVYISTYNIVRSNVLKA
jgi:hypothetical protein